MTALASPGCGDLEYEGEGDPDVLIASELTLGGPSRRASLQIVEAIRYELERRGWRAGEHRVAFQSCDDAKRGRRDLAACRRRTHARSPTSRPWSAWSATYYSDCAKAIVPALNTAPDGAIAMLSPLNVDVCLTEPSPACDRTEPDKYYPTGTRNYARLAPNLIFEAAALAQLAQRLGVGRVFLLTDREAYGVGVAPHFRRAARELGIRVVGSRSWAPDDPSYAALFRDVARSDADAILLAGVASQDGARLIREKVGVLGTNRAKVKLLAPDAFAEQALLDEAGAAAHGMYVVAPGVALRPSRRVRASSHGGSPPNASAAPRSTRTRCTAPRRSGSCSTRSLAPTARRAGVRRAVRDDGVRGPARVVPPRRKRRSGKRRAAQWWRSPRTAPASALCHWRPSRPGRPSSRRRAADRQAHAVSRARLGASVILPRA